ncbi:mitochondrial ribonuclease P catalytic subunit [Episyrphus balteatus]|uniref:mitochondrial ribonuclease P catalytic subunit n=1 Tax=Episyrphus balteatus TaxID=286459 RepID=UPI0024856771|nr:mitochondrial ribonuclease P catalytic subunit [Episyrphus balteatus]
MTFPQIKKFPYLLQFLTSNKNCLSTIIRNSNRNYKRTTISSLPRVNFVSEFKQKAHENSTHLCPTEWKKLREQLLANSRNIHLQNVDAIILGQCNSTEDLPIAKSYIEFLESQSIQPNNATLGKLLKIYYLSGKTSKLTEKDEMEILKIYNKIRAERDALDAVTCENLIHGLLATSYWKDSLDILKMIKLSSSPSIHVYSLIISKAFLSNEIDLGWKFLEEMIEADKQPTCEVYISYIQYSSLDSVKFVENIEKLFNFLGKYEILISEAVIEKLKGTIETLDHRINLTKLNGNGKCVNCQSHMRNISISDEEFEKLSSSFLERVLIRKDVFLKSSPKEVENFTKFIEKTGPFDCVIDGLNVAYSCGAKKPSKVFVNLLSSVVKYLKRQNKHVLVLGRKHMDTWPKEGMNYVKRNSCVFLTNNLTQDDPFLLYAAIKSGQSTDFFSRDLMRSHAFLLGAELKYIFKRWQQEHQYSLVTVSDKGIIVKEPTRHFKFAQKVNDTWHIPYKATYSPNPTEVLDVPENWICIKFKK